MRSPSVSTTSPPYALVAATLLWTADAGMTMVDAIRDAEAAYASACAWFPADNEMTPRSLSSGVR